MPDFDEWLLTHDLDAKMQEVVKAGLCFTEQNNSSCSREKWEAIGLYLHSAGRLNANSGPFVIPFYSCSDVPQVHLAEIEQERNCFIRRSVDFVLFTEASMFLSAASKQSYTIQKLPMKFSC